VRHPPSTSSETGIFSFFFCVGGCGTFYAITIASPEFKGIPVVKQHRLVNEVLKKEIEGIHGLQVLPFSLPFTRNIDALHSSKRFLGDERSYVLFLDGPSFIDAIFILQSA